MGGTQKGGEEMKILMDDPLTSRLRFPYVLLTAEWTPPQPTMTLDQAERTLERIVCVCVGIGIGLVIAWVMV